MVANLFAISRSSLHPSIIVNRVLEQCISHIFELKKYWILLIFSKLDFFTGIFQRYFVTLCKILTVRYLLSIMQSVGYCSRLYFTVVTLLTVLSLHFAVLEWRLRITQYCIISIYHMNIFEQICLNFIISCLLLFLVAPFIPFN